MSVNGYTISGLLKKVTGYTGFSGDTSEQSGNYLALKFAAAEGATVAVELLGGTVGHPVTLDEDMNCVFRIGDKDTQKIEVSVTEDGVTKKAVYSLTGLVLQKEAPSGT